VLMNTAPASHPDWTSLRQRLPSMRAPGDADRMRAIAARPDYLVGNLDAEAEYLRIHFRPTIRDPQLLERIVGRMRLHFDPDRVLVARAIDQRLSDETSNAPGYDLLAALASIDTPTLVLHAEHDLIPVDLAANIAAVMPQATLRVLPGLGHFAYAERPDVIAEEIERFLAPQEPT
jgi:pimeloyl-ACP methyl ester carboxylesterase